MGVRERFDEVLAKTVELGVSVWRSVGVDLKMLHYIVVHEDALRQ